MRKILLTASAIGLVLSGSNAKAADSVSSRINKLEQEIQLLKRQQEVSEEKSIAAAEKNANVEIGKKGLAISSPDKKYQLELHGVFQFDNRSFVGDENVTTGRSENLVRRARPTLNIKSGNASLVFTPDFAGTSTTSNNTKTIDAYTEYKFNNAAKVRFGKFKSPIGLEQLQSDPDTLFTERGYVASLIPQRDIGLQIAGEAITDILEYQAGIFNGGVDNGNTDGDNDGKKDFVARLFVKPFRNSDIVTLQGFGVGVGGSVGERDGSTSNRQLPTYVTPGQQTFFTYSSAAYADGTQWRASPQAYWYSGNKGILAEYAVSAQRVTNGASSVELQNKAWNVAASYVITGEDVSFSGGVKPANDFNPSEGNWGAWEVVARVGALKIDDKAFPLVSSISSSAKEAKSYGIGINWYLSENVKLATNYNYTEFDGGAAGGLDKPEEQVIQSRVQFRF